MITCFFLFYKTVIIFLFAKKFYNARFNIYYNFCYLLVRRHLADKTLQWRMCFGVCFGGKSQSRDLIGAEIPVIFSHLTESDQIPMAAEIINTNWLYFSFCAFIFFKRSIIYFNNRRTADSF